MIYKVKLKIFEGPLDLLLFLIKKNELDIYDIPIVEITDQYISYIEMMRELNLEIAGEFLVMASTLMHIKSKMLLPQEKKSFEEEEVDLREELVQQLLEYKKYKELSENFRKLELQQQEIFTRNNESIKEDYYLDVNLFELLTAVEKIFEVKLPEIVEIKEEEITVEQKIIEVLNLFKEQQIIDFSQIFNNCKTKMEIVITFLAILELVKTKKLKLYQVEQFGEIKIYKNLLPICINY